MYSLTKHNSFFQSATADQLGSASSHNMNIETEASNICALLSTPPSYIQRSIRSHAIHKDDSYSLPSLSEGPEDGPVRRFRSAGDLEGVSSCIAKGKENSIIIEGTMKASRYSPEEKRERINKYRSKKNLRNFKKKIRYECRKALADGRTRFKGRFVRNDEISTMTTTMMMTTMEGNITCSNLLSNDHSSTHHHRHHIMARGDEDGEGEEDGWINLLDYYS